MELLLKETPELEIHFSEVFFSSNKYYANVFPEGHVTVCYDTDIIIDLGLSR